MVANSFDEVKRRFSVKQRVDARAVRAVDNGLIFDVDGVEGFVHMLDWEFKAEGVTKRGLQAVVGQTVLVEVLAHNEAPDGRGRLQLSRVVCVDEALARLQPGAPVRGKIRSVNSFGAHAVVHGLRGMISKHDVEGDVEQLFAPGDDVDLEVIATDGGKLLLKPTAP